jgi:large subunit ribosomal protein L9
MKVILQQTVQKLGNAGDIVEASPGFYRNFLQPRKLAVLATDGALKKREEDKDALARKAEKAHQESAALAERISALQTIHIMARAGEGGKLFGKITTKEIAAAIVKALGEEVDKRLIKVDTISALGTYKATIKLATDVQAAFNVEVIAEGSLPTSSAKAAEEVVAVEPAEELTEETTEADA